MGQLQWLETFEIGVAEIDDDHRALLAVMREIQAAIEAADYPQGDELLISLMASAAAHFRREEEFLKRIDYPGLDIHIKYHADLLDQAETVRQVCSNRKQRDAMKNCIDSLFSFLIDDIISGDMRFKSYLEHKGLIKRTLPDSPG